MRSAWIQSLTPLHCVVSVRPWASSEGTRNKRKGGQEGEKNGGNQEGLGRGTLECRFMDLDAQHRADKGVNL